MALSRDALTPQTLLMLRTIERSGSFAAAARELGLVPSALTYRVRQLEESLDVLLFSRRSRQAQPTAAGLELLRQGERVLLELEALANRVQRIATGWESELTLAVDGLIQSDPIIDLCEQFLSLGAPTRLRWRQETLGGTLEALARGDADLAIGTALSQMALPGLAQEPLGQVEFLFAVAPEHPLAHQPQPWSAQTISAHRVVAVADSAVRDRLTVGVQSGQDVLTVPTLQAKLDAQLRGLGVGFLPRHMAEPHLRTKRLLAGESADNRRETRIGYAWRNTESHGSPPGRALKWWLQKLKHPTTRRALLEPASKR
ncbi:MAG: LysR family transcriptional regulator [Alphaproteobacteria bacterium]|nr:LysR family transcriptional regulator [Alphaproteobacteria bacterium]